MGASEKEAQSEVGPDPWKTSSTTPSKSVARDAKNEEDQKPSCTAPCNRPNPGYCGFTEPGCCEGEPKECWSNCTSGDSPLEGADGADSVCYTQVGGSGVCVSKAACTAAAGLVTDAECARRCYDGVGCLDTCLGRDLRRTPPANSSECISSCEEEAEGRDGCFQLCEIQSRSCEAVCEELMAVDAGKKSNVPEGPIDSRCGIVDAPPHHLAQMSAYPPYPFMSTVSEDEEHVDEALLGPENQWILLNLHNKLRERSAYAGGDPPPVCWDLRLQRIAKAHAQRVRSEADCGLRIKPSWVGGDESTDPGTPACAVRTGGGEAKNDCQEDENGIGVMCTDYLALNAYKAVIPSGLDDQLATLSWADVVGDVWAAGGCPNREAHKSHRRVQQYDAMMRASHDRVGCHMEKFSLGDCLPDYDAAVFFCAYDSSLVGDGPKCGREGRSGCGGAPGAPGHGGHGLPTDFCRQYVCERKDPEL